MDEQAIWREALASAAIRLPKSALCTQATSCSPFTKRYEISTGAGKEPQYIVKVSHRPQGQLSLRREYDALRHLWQIDALRPSIPYAYGLSRINQYQFLITNAQPGVRLSETIGARNRAPHARLSDNITLTMEWLRLLQSATLQQQPSPFPAGHLVESCLNRLQPSDVSPDVERRLVTLAARYEGLPIRRCSKHGNLHPSNVVMTSHHSIGVSDWSRFHESAWPYQDIIHFLTQVSAVQQSLAAKRPRLLRFLKPTRRAPIEQLAAWSTTPLAQAGLPADIASFLFTISLLDMVVETRDRSVMEEASNQQPISQDAPSIQGQFELISAALAT